MTLPLVPVGGTGYGAARKPFPRSLLDDEKCDYEEGHDREQGQQQEGAAVGVVRAQHGRPEYPIGEGREDGGQEGSNNPRQGLRWAGFRVRGPEERFSVASGWSVLHAACSMRNQMRWQACSRQASRQAAGGRAATGRRAATRGPCLGRSCSMQHACCVGCCALGQCKIQPLLVRGEGPRRGFKNSRCSPCSSSCTGSCRTSPT
jgi:hypothetical protein